MATRPTSATRRLRSSTKIRVTFLDDMRDSPYSGSLTRGGCGSVSPPTDPVRGAVVDALVDFGDLVELLEDRIPDADLALDVRLAGGVVGFEADIELDRADLDATSLPFGVSASGVIFSASFVPPATQRQESSTEPSSSSIPTHAWMLGILIPSRLVAGRSSIFSTPPSVSSGISATVPADRPPAG